MTEELSRADFLRASPPIFESRLLDRLTRVHPAVPVLIFLPAIVAFAFEGFSRLSVPDALLGVFIGYAVWTISEYWIHRGLFHFEPKDGIGARVHWVIHGVHHDHPNDPKRLVMPPVVSVPIGAAFFFLFYAIVGLPSAWPVAAGFFAGYLAYDMIHFALHHGRAHGRVTKLLRELHMRHHFEDDRCGFAISAPWWDVAFRTYSPRARRQQSA
ncbi:MAG TPA: sterol desaturase family protein [Gaiellaceae bacterium]|nr:sterol desaturase family protein [Gaiellaceae bacterium]